MNSFPVISLIISAVSLIAAAYCIYHLLDLRKLRNTFFSGKDVGSLEQFILNQNVKINELDKRADYIEEGIKQIAEQQKLAIQKLGMVRYNPFADDGGNLSFSIALLDDLDNGVVITSMHSREQNRVYSKPILKGKSEFTLTEEEKKAIKEAKVIKELNK